MVSQNGLRQRKEGSIPSLATKPVDSQQVTKRKRMEMANVNRRDDGSSYWDCQRCGKEVNRYRGQGDVSCQCGAQYNAFGQRLRDDWQGNPSNYDDDISDLEGYEIQHADY